MVHGENDSVVPVEQSRLMALACTEAGVPVELTIVKGAGHALTFVDAEDYISPSIEFLRRAFS
ncbi:alpha/beta hydrolase family protein [Bifidobacterium subtile]